MKLLTPFGKSIDVPDREKLVIGRMDPTENVMPDIDTTHLDGEASGVSRQHAQLIRQAGQYYIRDLDSLNFTYVNRRRLGPNEARRLSPGDEIRLGRLNFIVCQ